MDTALLRLVGTALEVSGAFLLAVEAIKIDNLRFLRERVLKAAALRINPVIHFVDAESKKGKKQAAETWLNIVFVFFILLGLGMAYSLFRLAGIALQDVWGGFSEFVPGPLWVDILVAVPVGFLSLVVAGVLGSSAYTVVVLVLDAMIAGLAFIERHTATGIVGIMGFLLFLAGAALKAYLDWTGA